MKEILKTAVRPSSILSALTGSVCRRVALVVFLVVILLDAVVTVPVYLTEKESFVRDRTVEALALFSAAVDPTIYPSIETLTRIGDNLVRSTKVDGGVIISGAGEDRAVFGIAPSLTWAEARLGGETSRFDSAAGTFDIFISPERSQLPYGVILRLGVGPDWQALTGNLLEQALLLFAVAIVLSMLTSLIVANQVVRPVETVLKAIEFALDTPEESANFHTGISRNDEIGALARAVDQLIFLTSTTFADDLAAAVSILDMSPHGILTFSEQGHLMSANRAALSLFGERTFEGLLNRDPKSLFRFGDETVDCIQFAGRGRVLGPGEILHDPEDFPCLVAGDTVKRSDGTVLRRFLIFVDMRDLVEQVRNEVRRREAAESMVKQLNGDIRLMRRLFDACLVVTDLDGGTEGRSNAVTLQPRGMIDAWMERLKADGETMPANVEIGELPPVVGNPAELRRLFDTVLEVVRLRSAAPAPGLSIVGFNGGDTVSIVVREVAADGGDAAISSDTDVAILLGAAGTLCRRQQGSLVAMKGKDEANQIAFRLKIDIKVADDPENSEAA